MPTWADFREAAIDVVTQMTILVVFPGIIILLLAAYGQGIYAITNGAASHPLSATEYLLGINKIVDKDEQLNILGLAVDYVEVGWNANINVGRGSFMWADWMYFISTMYGAVWIFRLMYSYYDPRNSFVRQVMYKLFAVALTVTIWMICIWLSMSAVCKNNPLCYVAI